MSRYERVYRTQDNLYLKGSPVIIAAGALLKDGQTGGVVAQLKFLSLSVNKIISLKVALTCFDPARREVCREEHTYLDLAASFGNSFGDREAIRLSSPVARSFTALVTEVVFESGELWQNDDPFTLQLPNKKAVDPQYSPSWKDTFGEFAVFVPFVFEDLWVCTCGAVHQNKQTSCPVCGNQMDLLISAGPEAIQKEFTYKNASLKAHSSTKDTLTLAVELFRQIPDYKDSDDQAAICQKKIEEIKAKEEADRLERARQVEQRRIAAEIAKKERQKKIKKIQKKIKKIFWIASPIVVACIAFVIVLTTVIIPKQKLNKAMGLLDSGDYEAAYALLEEIGNSDAIASSKYDRAVALIDSGDYEAAHMLLNGLNYKDSVDKLNSIKPQYQKNLLSKAQVGSYVYFGAYEQDNNTSNGKEDIEWLVLAKEGNKVLVISKYALDCQRYNTSYTNVTWETCSLRKWLNGTFLSAAFSSEEQNSIISSTVTADKNPSYSTSPGNNTTDKVFLLSINEVNKYFSSDSARQCQGTAYCYAQGAYKASNGNCWWWLRSPGDDSDRAAYVRSDGSVNSNGGFVDSDSGGVCPALWIDLSSF